MAKTTAAQAAKTGVDANSASAEDLNTAAQPGTDAGSEARRVLLEAQAGMEKLQALNTTRVVNAETGLVLEQIGNLANQLDGRKLAA